MNVFRDYVPIDMHCHGIGSFDFVDPSKLVLDKIDKQLRIEGHRAILTLYIPHSKINELEKLAEDFYQGVLDARYCNIIGIAIEGPLLSSIGGTPEQGCWRASKDEWRRLAAIGKKGLKYIVLSPDAEYGTNTDTNYPDSINWIVDLLYENGVRPSLGHYKKDNPEKAAYQTLKIIEHISINKYPPLFTDHFFNDMPLNFKHSWRSLKEKKERTKDINDLQLNEWDKSNIRQKLGAVPAAIIEGAHNGNVKICMNFDGEHVDLEICKKAIEIIESQNIMLMTDRIQSQVLAGQKLYLKGDSTLLYQHFNIVAGGTQSVMAQLMKMINVGIGVEDILNIICITSANQLGLQPFFYVPALEKCEKEELYNV
jgi:N-acetylglucosamine-6-phosphate deacetylase